MLRLRTPLPLSSHRTAAAAYRRDVAANPTRSALATPDGVWIAIGTTCQRAAALAHVDMARPLLAEAQRMAVGCLGGDPANGRPRLDPPQSPRSEHDVLRLVVEGMEDVGAYHLATVTLDALAALPSVTKLDRGRIIAHAARIARSMGELERAAHLYGHVERVGRDADLPELLVRAWVGQAVVAQVKGNAPEARRRAKRALSAAVRHDFTRLGALARTTLMIVEAKAGRFEEALLEGWQVFLAMRGDAAGEASILSNLGQMLLDMDMPAAARAAYKALFARTSLPRIVLPALGGYAAASAAVDRVDELQWAASEVVLAVAVGHPPYETANALLECAGAMKSVGLEDHARGLLREAIRLAGRHGYHEIAVRAEWAQGIVGTPAGPARCERSPGPGAVAIVGAISALEPAERPAHVLALTAD